MHATLTEARACMLIPAAEEYAPHFTSREVPAQDVETRQAFERLRFDVYCVECGFLPAQDYPGGRESDAWDPHSSHVCAHNLAGDLVGYVRLARPDAAGRLPFQDHCGDVSLQGGPLLQSGEISRLMVRSTYRRRQGDLLAGVNVASPQPDSDRRRSPSPQILLSLYRCLYARSLADGVRFWYAAMERPLARSLRSMGFVFRQIGPETDYYGPVAPYLTDLRELEASVTDKHPELMRWLRAMPLPPAQS